MADESDLERTEAATPRRLEKAREEGQVARSPELTTCVMLATGTGGLWLAGGDLFGRLRELVGGGLTFDATALATTEGMLVALERESYFALAATAPLLLLLVAGALVAPQLLGGWLFSAGALRVDARRVDPMAGFGRIFSLHGL